MSCDVVETALLMAGWCSIDMCCVPGRPEVTCRALLATPLEQSCVGSGRKKATCAQRQEQHSLRGRRLGEQEEHEQRQCNQTEPKERGGATLREHSIWAQPDDERQPVNGIEGVPSFELPAVKNL